MRILTWRSELIRELELHGETMNDIVSCTLTEEQLDEEFYGDHGSRAGYPKGRSFTAWTAKRVYFPDNYDGFQEVTSVSRHPDGIPTGKTPYEDD